MSGAPDPLRDFYRTLTGKGAEPLEPTDPYYVPILQATPEKDPILGLYKRLDYSVSESVNLLTGFRGNGKSTELRRLRRLLEGDGCRVLLVNMLDYVLMTRPVELSDFLLSLMAALADMAEKESGLQALGRSFSERLVQFLNSEVQLDNLGLEAGLKDPAGVAQVGAKLGLRLKTETSFKEQVQERMRGHVTALVEHSRRFVVQLVVEMRRIQKNPDLKVVLLVDSVEQLRGVGEEAHQVHESVVELFSAQADSLQFPLLHVVYTIPPYLTPLAQNLGRSLGGNPITSWPNIHVRTRQGADDPQGFRVLEDVIQRRFSSWKQVFRPEQLHRLARAAGGDLRDFFRLVRETLIGLATSGLQQPNDELLKRVEDQLRNELLPVAEDDAKWLARIHETKEACLPSTKQLPALARFLDSNLIMNYLNGESWYDIHPLLLEEIRRHLPSGLVSGASA